jgi:hypothetical protein
MGNKGSVYEQQGAEVDGSCHSKEGSKWIRGIRGIRGTRGWRVYITYLVPCT